ncbi:hypothetical protein L9W92_01380 [Pelotomaculum terephthalicicum JT]|uniref:hypothetical protein n=1 Tax=Pelotomaculum TaxID=191373 RepID=UPI0009D59592|nr:MULTISPECIES: hypothetical protein [Pelotomaculum]MCG9966708.1 hypothetical protein [Pelotomaculum terephthalicicum JT]OPX91433.1 MAG: hypothetical protein A4E54_00258 [Pelotomaculum sp. PtaB.Bin117]OPY62969.1 MAG: hypothetical protein A4E56_00925 [Pelotomaculum sp. PtaU1.Bin065]
MMDDDDFKKIEGLFEKCCDNCLLTRQHCSSCRISKLRGIFHQCKQPGTHEVFLININDLRVLLDLAEESAGAHKHDVVDKWRRAIGKEKAAAAI